MRHRYPHHISLGHPLHISRDSFPIYIIGMILITPLLYIKYNIKIKRDVPLIAFLRQCLHTVAFSLNHRPLIVRHVLWFGHLIHLSLLMGNKADMSRQETWLVNHTVLCWRNRWIHSRSLWQEVCHVAGVSVKTCEDQSADKSWMTEV